MDSVNVVRFLHSTFGSYDFREANPEITQKYIEQLDTTLDVIKYSDFSTMYKKWSEINGTNTRVPSTQLIIKICHKMCEDVNMNSKTIMFDCKINTYDNGSGYYFTFDRNTIASHVEHMTNTQILSQRNINRVKSMKTNHEKFTEYFKYDPYTAEKIVSNAFVNLNLKEYLYNMKHMDMTQFTDDELSLKRYEPLQLQMKKLHLWQGIIKSNSNAVKLVTVESVSKYAGVNVVTANVLINDGRTILLEALPTHYAKSNDMWMHVIKTAQEEEEIREEVIRQSKRQKVSA
tara:strand:- start:764 stop:1630 length:867 start_codon:yes stop_codon:yes gene_type:complete